MNDYTTNGKKSLKDVQGKIRLHPHPFFGEHRKMTTITTATLREFVAARQEAEASNAEINRELAVLRRAFNLAIQAGRLLAKLFPDAEGTQHPHRVCRTGPDRPHLRRAGGQ